MSEDSGDFYEDDEHLDLVVAAFDWRCELSSTIEESEYTRAPVIKMCGKAATLRRHPLVWSSFAACDGCWTRWLARQNGEDESS